jgi:hypothetical protein
MTNQSKALLFTAILVGVFGSTACKQQVPVEPADTANAAADQQVPAKPARPRVKPLPNIATAARIAEIESSGRTGFWSSVTEFCPGKTSRSTVLTWNVSASGAKNVVVYVIDKKLNQERHFGRGGPIGERQTGPWLSPAGIHFKLRNADGGAELGDIVIGRAASC